MGNGSPRVFVLGLDGVPHSLAKRFAEAGVMPHLNQLMNHGAAVQYDSILPTVSNVALWYDNLAGQCRTFCNRSSKVA